MTFKLTDRQKLIASCIKPLAGGFSTRAEVKKIKLKARSHYWIDRDWNEFCSFSPDGKRAWFPYSIASPVIPSQEKAWLNLARKAAYYWAKGKKEKANNLFDEIYAMKIKWSKKNKW